MAAPAWIEWLQGAQKVFEGSDTNALLDRAIRARGTADEVILSYAVLQELRALRRDLTPTRGKAARAR
jgi:hypothetical protein